MIQIVRHPIVRLGEIAGGGQYGLNAPALKEGKGTRFIRITDIDDHGDLRPDSLAYVAVSPEDFKKYAVYGGDILIARSGATAGKSLLVKPQDSPAVFAGYLIRFRADPGKVMPEFLGAFLQGNAYWTQIEATKRVAAQPNVNAQELAQLRIPLPPLDEQRRIVDILNHAASIRRLRDEAKAKAREIIPALFVEMFGDPATNPKGWEVRTVGDVLSAADYGTSQKATDAPPGIPVLRMGNVSASGKLQLDNLKYIDMDEEEASKLRLQSGDILFNRTNSKDLVGKTGLWDGRFDAIAASYFIRLRTKPSVMSPTYFWAFFNGKFMKRRLFETARGAIGQSNINTKELRAFAIAVPPLPLQQEFAERVAEVEGISTLNDKAVMAAEQLAQSLMSQVFGAAA